MKEINGVKLLELLNEAKEQGIGFTIGQQSVQGLYGVFVEFEKTIRYDNDRFNVALIQEIKS